MKIIVRHGKRRVDHILSVCIFLVLCFLAPRRRYHRRIASKKEKRSLMHAFGTLFSMDVCRPKKHTDSRLQRRWRLWCKKASTPHCGSRGAVTLFLWVFLSITVLTPPFRSALFRYRIFCVSLPFLARPDSG